MFLRALCFSEVALIPFINASPKLGFKKESTELANSLQGYLNTYNSLMTSSLKSLDFFYSFVENNVCTDKGC